MTQLGLELKAPRRKWRPWQRKEYTRRLEILVMEKNLEIERLKERLANELPKDREGSHV